MAENEKKVIDEADYQVNQPAPSIQRGPAIVGQGGDPLFRRIRATKEQLIELLDETTTVQDWVQRETCNNVALSCLDNENLKDVYFKIKDGFKEYGPIVLMGFKTPQGVEIPRLKLLDKDGNVQQILTGPLAIEELNKRALAYQETQTTYEVLQNVEEISELIEDEAVISEVIKDYSGNP